MRHADRWRALYETAKEGMLEAFNDSFEAINEAFVERYAREGEQREISL